MGNCLVTKLKGVVDNDNILKLGEIRFLTSKSDSINRCYLSFTESTTVKIINDGHFYNSTTSDLGKNLSLLPQQSSVNTKVSPGSLIQINNKYALASISFGTLENKISLAELKYSPLVYLYAEKDNIEGDISNLAGKQMDFLGVINNPSVYGDIAALKGMPLTVLQIQGTQVTGDVSALKGMALTIVQITNLITGDISNLSSVMAEEIPAMNLSGDLSALTSTTLHHVSSEGINPFTWKGERDSSLKILSLWNIRMNEDVDKMLINQAKCQTGFNSDSPSWYKTLKIIGTRTSASDAAVQTLQSKGYTVSVTPA